MPSIPTLQRRKHLKERRLARSKSHAVRLRLKHAIANIKAALARRKAARKKAQARSPFAMYDDTTASLIPADAPAVACYVNGRYANCPEVASRFPKAKHLTIAVTSDANAECLDVEPGDATNADAPAWVRRQHARGIGRPVLYTSISNAGALLTTLARVGIKRDQIRLWTAHYTHHAHICNASCGYGQIQADATQWTDRSHGRSLDESLCSPDFL